GVLESESGILPVSLLYWRGTQREAGALLSWSTATEIDNDYFTIERSVDGVSWKTIATVAGHGTTTEVKEYEYFDRNHFLPATYYRLSQTDYDGTTEVFEILMVTGRESLTPVILYPNPSSGKFAVQLPVGDHTIEVLDMIGKRINMDVKREGNLASFDLSGRPSGIYILRVIDPKGANNYRIRLK
ncbi:MAG: T9SS type A sorting domain-containing protein, partial [Bacteroidota bacterium]